MALAADQILERARAQLLASAEVKRLTAEKCLESILKAGELMAASLKAGGKILLCGNGGSAADCQHLATEFMSIMDKDFQRTGLAALALTTDTSYLTAVSNDFGYEHVFERQVRSLGKPGDVLIGISTSGNSLNVLNAIETASSMGMSTIALTGNTGQLAARSTVAVCIPSSDTQRIQEAHLAVEHTLCDLVECHLFGKAEHRDRSGSTSQEML
jgi:D-sedoheptulose 7-phosphate isomerase